MKIKEILSEDRQAFVPAGTDLTTDEEFNKRFEQYVVPMLLKNCGQAIQAYKIVYPKLVYRGVKTGIEEFISPVVSEKRISYLDSGIRELINRSLVNMGATAHRSNSIFCTSTTIMARSWGTEYIVFPYDNFSVTWFSNVSEGYILDDIVELIQDEQYDAVGPEEQQRILDNWKKQKVFEKIFIKSGLNHANNTQGIVGALQSSAEELLISSSSYIGLKNHLYKNVIPKWLASKTPGQ